MDLIRTTQKPKIFNDIVNSGYGKVSESDESIRYYVIEHIIEKN